MPRTTKTAPVVHDSAKTIEQLIAQLQSARRELQVESERLETAIQALTGRKRVGRPPSA